jgi:Na+/proline symporter
MLGAAVIAFVIAAVNGWFATGELLDLLRGFQAGSPVIASGQYIFRGLLLTPFSVSLGLIALFSKQATPEQMKNASARSLKWSGRYMIFVLASIVAALIAPILQYGTVNYLALQRGYVSCPTPNWPRHQPDRWALPGPHAKTERCPGEGADPRTQSGEPM